MRSLATFASRASSSELVRHGLLVFVSLTGANLLNYAFYAIVGRMVGVENYGAFSSVGAAVIICLTPAIVGQTIIAKLAADFRAADDRDGLRGFASAVTRFALILGVALGLAGILLARPLAEFLRIPDSLLVAIGATSLAAGIVMWLQRGIFQGAGAFGSYGISNLLEGLGKTVFAPIFVLAYGVRGAFIGMTLALGVAVLYNTVRIRQRFGRTGRRFHASAYRMIAGASNTGAAVLAIATLQLFDVILVTHYFGLREAGLYGAAALIGRALFTVVAFVPTVVLPKASSDLAADRSPLPLLFAAGGVTLACCASALVLFRLAPVDVLTAIAGKKFAAAAPLVFPYGCATAALAVANVCVMYKIGLHRFDFVRPLVAVMCGEILSVVLRHRSLIDVLQTIIIGHALALIVVAWRLTVVPEKVTLDEVVESSA